MRQRLGLAIASARKPTVLLLDERLVDLDSKAANEFPRSLREVAATGAFGRLKEKPKSREGQQDHPAGESTPTCLSARQR